MSAISVRKWLLLLVFCGVAGILILALYGKWQVGRIYDSASYANANTVPKIVALTDAQAHFTRWRLALYRHVASDGEAEKHDATVVHERDATRLALSRYETLIGDAQEQRNLEILRALLAEYELATPLVDEKIHAGDAKQALNILLAQAAAADRVIEALDDLIVANVVQGRAEDAAALTTFKQASWITLAFVIAVIAVLLAAGFAISRRVTEQIERIRALGQDNEMFRLMLEGTSNQGVMLHDISDQGRVIYANAAACRHFGVELATILEWRPQDFDPNASERMAHALESALAESGTYTFETVHRVAAGELVPVEVTTNCFEHGGRMLGMAFVRDLRPQREAESRRMEMQLLEAEHENARRLTRFAQCAPGFMYTVEQSPDGNIVMTYASPAVETIYGLGMEDVLADVENIYALIVPEDLERVMQLISESFRKLSPFHAEYRIHHATKGERWMEAVSMPDAMEDGTVQWHGFVTDITERKQMEEQLAAREREFRTLIENAPDNIARYDRDMRVLYVNPVLERTLGRKAEDLLGKRPFETLPGLPIIEEYQRVLARVLETGEPAEYLLVNEASDGGRALYDNIRIAPEFSKDGKIIGAITIGRDLTRQKTLEMELARREREFRMLSENSPDMIIRYGLDCRRTYVNQAFLNYTGASAEAVLGKALSESAWWPLNISAPEFEERLQRVIDTGESATFKLYGTTSQNGDARYAMALIVPEYAEDGRIESMLAVVRDVSDLVLTEQELQQREQYQRALLDNFPFFVWLKDIDSRLLAANHQFARVAQVATTQELVGKTDFDFFPPDLAAGYVADDREVLAEGVPKNVVEQYCDEEGRWKWMETYKSPVVVDGETVGTVGFSRDITEKMQLQMDLASREREFRTLVENSPDTICRYDPDCKRIYANPRMVESFRVPLPELLGTSPAELPGGESAQTYEQAIRQVFASSEAVDFELNWQNGAGQRFCTHIRLMPEFDVEGGDVVSVLAVGRDITEIDEYRKRVHQMAFFDTLTGLPNRALLNDRIGHTIADAAYHGHRFGLMVLDLDGFKEVNDTLGHGVGDLLLCEVGMRLLACVRSYDTVARLGGDEFSVLLPEVRQDSDAGTVARKILATLARPFMINGKELFISASIGIALYPSDSAEIDALFRYADSSMYHAKKQGRNNFQFYSKEITARSAGRMALESALRRAQEKNELELYYQPQMDIINDRLIGVEALLRWNRNGHDMVPPDHFIPIAEETGLIVGIGEWVLTTACEAAVAWNRDRKTPLKVSVNLSTRQFLRNNLAESIRTVLTTTDCKPEWLGLEITESLLLDDAEEIRRALAELDAMGLSIAIDDFGTGYSALGYLNRFPVSVLKIDRSFVHGITTDRDRAELVKAIVSMARSLRMGLVAEGVETDAQAAYLSNLGCHVVQGYLYGRPMPRADLEALLMSREVTI